VKTPPALRLAYTGFAVIGLAVVSAYVYQRHTQTAQTLVASGAVSAHVDGTVPASRPEFTLSSLDGKRHSITEWDGHPQLVNFWATWCGPCRKEIPLLNQIQADYADRGLKIIGIAVDFPQDVAKFITKIPLSYDVLVGEDDALEAAKAYGVESMALPFSAFVDSHGRVLTVHLGELHERNLRATLDILYRFDAGTLDRKDVPAALDAVAAAYPTKEPTNPN
jgi:thiol-disulfide isomerase/thioredoxin